MDFQKQCIWIIITLLLPLFSVASNKHSKHQVHIRVDEHALLSLKSDQSQIHFKSISPASAGSSINFKGSDKTQGVWINYSSITASEQSRNISAALEGEIPEGLSIKLVPHAYEGGGRGKFGTPSSPIILSTQPTEIILGIGSCYTGTGPNKGHFIAYELDIKNKGDLYGNLSEIEQNLQVVYTFTDNN